MRVKVFSTRSWLIQSVRSGRVRFSVSRESRFAHFRGSIGRGQVGRVRSLVQVRFDAVGRIGLCAMSNITSFVLESGSVRPEVFLIDLIPKIIVTNYRAVHASGFSYPVEAQE